MLANIDTKLVQVYYLQITSSIVMVIKRIEAFIASEKTPYVLSALDDLGLQATFFDSKGMGKGEKYTVSYGKG
jgi:hypothetical protein